MDLVALNVQRGRDHGLPPYLEWRKICGLPRITSWQELAAVVEKPNVSSRLSLKKLFALEFHLRCRLAH